MALPFLPEHEISQMFDRLQIKATTPPPQKKVEYISNTWVNSSTWPPSTWSIFDMSVRTNNDIEGWHNRINKRAAGKCNLPFYLFVKLIHQEARLTAVHIRLVSEKKLQGIRKRKYRELQGQILRLWQKYTNKESSAYQLLKACTHLIEPVNT